MSMITKIRIDSPVTLRELAINDKIDEINKMGIRCNQLFQALNLSIGFIAGFLTGLLAASFYILTNV